MNRRRLSRSVLPSFVVSILMATLFLAAPLPSASAAVPVLAGTYQESSASVSYTGTWTKLTSAGSSGGAMRFATSSTASANLTFVGTTIAWYTWKSASAGIVDVYIDGLKQASVDNYAPSTTTGVIGYRTTTLAAGTHTITIKASGQKNAASSARYTHFDSFVVGADRSALTAPVAAGRYATCPAATVTVATSAELRTALAAARAGSVIHLSPGTYSDGFKLTTGGTAVAPIWICGPPTAVVKGTQTDAALWVEFAGDVNITGFTVADSLQGIMVRSSNRISITDMQVRDTGYEGIHLYRNTTDSQVMHNSITRTGVADVAFGEGVYVGTSQRRWAEVTGGQPDRSDRNVVAFNTITAAGAEGIEAKEGTSYGVIAGNTVNGHLPNSRAIAWILVTGNSWYVAKNTGSAAVEHGYASMVWDTWGTKNQFFGNAGTVDASGYGVWVHQRNKGVLVACDNVPTAAGSGLSNDFCTP